MTSAMSFAAARTLIDRFAADLAGRADEGAAEVTRRLAEQKLDAAHFTPPQPSTLPVARYFRGCAASDAELLAIEDHLCWRQTTAYTDAILGEGFTANYGWTQLIGPRGFFPGDDFLLGLLMLGPHRHYPDHYHPAPELYLPLTSGTLWRREPEGLVEKDAGTLIWHQPNQIHAIRTQDQPLLALWVWTRDATVPARLSEKA